MKEHKKIHGMNEISYVLALIICAFAVCIGTKADFGISVVAAPGYLYNKIFSEYIPWLTQGRAEYIWQGVQLLIMCLIIRKFKTKYFLSIIASLFSGILIDTWFLILGGNGAYEGIFMRIAAFIIGQICLGFAVTLFFRTSMPLQLCELVLVEIAKHFKISSSKMKIIYDMINLALSLALSLIFTHGLTGIGIGTVIIAFCTSPLTVVFGKILDRFFVFDSIFKKRA